MDSRSPLSKLCTKRKTRVKCFTIIQQERLASAGHLVTTFEFFRFRFHFLARDQVHFPQGKSANVVRGAFGTVLRDAVPPEVYSRLFEPGSSLGAAPSGLADWPRPFVLRVAHLDGLTVPAGDSFYLDAHVFDLHQPTLVHFRAALSRLAEKGLGPGRGRAELERTEQLDVGGVAQAVWETSTAPIVVGLDPETLPVETVTVRFQTPTELKSAGGLAERPEFPSSSDGCATASARCARCTEPARWTSILKALASAPRGSSCAAAISSGNRSSARAAAPAKSTQSEVLPARRNMPATWPNSSLAPRRPLGGCGAADGLGKGDVRVL